MSDDLKNILERVRGLYLKYGIKSITMDDVSRELGISKKTLYQHVHDKDELVGLIVDMEIDRQQQVFDNIKHLEKNAIENLIEIHIFINEILKEYNASVDYDLKKYYPALFEKIKKVKRQKMYDCTLANIRKGKDEGLYRADLNEEIIAKAHVSRIESITDSELLTLFEFLSPAAYSEIMIYHIRGMATNKGIEVLEQNLGKLKNY